MKIVGGHMVNDIKLDGSTTGASADANKVQQTAAANPIASSVAGIAAGGKKEQGVTVTNNLSSLVKIVAGSGIESDDSGRVAAVKALIQSGQYQVNHNDLTDKLLNSGLITGD